MNQLPTRQRMRRELRRKRMAIPPRQRHLLAMRLARQLARFKPLRYAQFIAAYQATGSELSLAPWLNAQNARQVHLPRIRGRHMDFYLTSQNLHTNRHGIAEPRRTRARAPWALSVILIPLLGFDQSGNRLGQGGGYYDRCLARLRLRRPWLVGIAYDQQQCDDIPVAAWDQALDAVVTPTRTLIFRT